MDERAELAFSPYHRFTRAQWAALRADTPLTLTTEDLARLQSINEPITLEDVIAIYLPLSRLLALYVAATQGLFKATQRFLGAGGGVHDPPAGGPAEGHRYRGLGAVPVRRGARVPLRGSGTGNHALRPRRAGPAGP